MDIKIIGGAQPIEISKNAKMWKVSQYGNPNTFYMKSKHVEYIEDMNIVIGFKCRVGYINMYNEDVEELKYTEEYDVCLITTNPSRLPLCINCIGEVPRDHKLIHINGNKNDPLLTLLDGWRNVSHIYYPMTNMLYEIAHADRDSWVKCICSIDESTGIVRAAYVDKYYVNDGMLLQFKYEEGLLKKDER